MFDYVSCTAFWLIFTGMLCLIGRQICKKESFSEAFISGYLLYSFFVAIGGIVVQLFNLPWIYFAVFMGILWCILVVLIVISCKKKKICLSALDVKHYLKNNWVIYLTLFILVGITLLYYAGFWLGNHQDDGYYLTKVATLPYSQTGGSFMYPVGTARNAFNTYIVNTWEIEASVYVKALGVSPTLYLRLFQSSFLFFLYLNLIKILAEKIYRNSGLKVKESFAQLPVIIVLLFDAHYLFLSDTFLFRLRDMFMVNTGMFLGNSIVRMLGILLLLYAFVDLEKITAKMIIGVLMISVVLMSKSTIALPMILITSVASLVSWLWLDYGKKGKYIAVVFSIVYVISSVILSNKPEIQSVVWDDVMNALRSPVIWACAVVFLCSFALKSKIIYRINIILCVMGSLFVFPELNDVFEHFSIYNFVGGRTVTAWMYFFVIINIIYFVLILTKLGMEAYKIRSLYLLFAISLTVISLIGFKLFGGGLILDQPRVGASIKNSIKILKDNPYFMPSATIELGNKLNFLSKEYPEQLRVVSPKMIMEDNALHPVAIFLRIYAPDVISLSAVERYQTHDGTELSKYTQHYYEAFDISPSDETAEAFWEEIQELDVNCIVVQNAECAPWLEEKGYELYDEVEGSYFIWSRK